MRALRFQPFQPEILRRSELILAGADTNSVELRKLTLEWLGQHQDEIPDLSSRLKAYLELENNDDNRKLARSLLDVLGT